MIDDIIKKFNQHDSLTKSKRKIQRISYRTPEKSTISNTCLSLKGNSHSHKSYSKSNQAFINSQIRQFETHPNSSVAMMIRQLTSLENQVCSKSNHNKHRLKYICFERKCSERVGCCCCFQAQHRGHIKLQISECLKDLVEFNQLTKLSCEKIISNKLAIRNQLISDIDKQIKNLCDEFHFNLQFLKNKAIREVDEYLFKRLEGEQNVKEFETTRYEKTGQIIKNIVELDMTGIKKKLEKDLNSFQLLRIDLSTITKYFEEMNGSLGHFMAEFKRCFPKLYITTSQAQAHAIDKEISKRVIEQWPLDKGVSS